MTRKEMSFEEQIMFKDKYTSTFSRRIEANMFLNQSNILQRVKKMFYEQLAVFCVECILMGVLWYYSMNKQIFLILCNICIIVANTRFKNWTVQFGWYPCIFPSLSWGIFVEVMPYDQSRASKNIAWVIIEDIPKEIFRYFQGLGTFSISLRLKSI